MSRHLRVLRSTGLVEVELLQDDGRGRHFERVGGRTRVTLEHRGLDQLPAEVAARMERYSWIEFMRWFGEYVAGRAPGS